MAILQIPADNWQLTPTTKLSLLAILKQRLRLRKVVLYRGKTRVQSQGLLELGNRIVESSLLKEGRAQAAVGLRKFRIDFDGHFVLLNCLAQLPVSQVGIAEIGVRFRIVGVDLQ